MKIALLVLIAFGLVGCTDAKKTREALDDMGFSEIQPKGYSYFGCGDDYLYHTEFTALNPKGKPVSGVVCCGYFKGCSVKF